MQSSGNLLFLHHNPIFNSDFSSTCNQPHPEICQYLTFCVCYYGHNTDGGTNNQIEGISNAPSLLHNRGKKLSENQKIESTLHFVAICYPEQINGPMQVYAMRV